MTVDISFIDYNGKESKTQGHGCFGMLANPSSIFTYHKIKHEDVDIVVYKGFKGDLINLRANDSYLELMSAALPIKDYVHYMPKTTLDFFNKGMQISSSVPAPVMVGLFEMFRHMFSYPKTISHILSIHGCYTNNILLSWYINKFVSSPFIDTAGVAEFNEVDLMPKNKMYEKGYEVFNKEHLDIIKKMPSFHKSGKYTGIYDLFSTGKTLIPLTRPALGVLYPVLASNYTRSLYQGISHEAALKLRDKHRGMIRRNYAEGEIRSLVNLIRGEP